MGRPSLYTPELGALICERLGEGNSIQKLCRADDMPAARTVYYWLTQHKEFLQMYETCALERADAIFEEAIEIADNGTNDWMERQSESEKGLGVNNGWVLNGEHVQRSRLRVDTRKWFVAKLYPKKYGEKVQVGGDAENPIKHEHDVAVRPQLTREEWLKLHSGNGGKDEK